MENNKEEKLTLKEKIKNRKTAFDEKHPKLKKTLLKIGLGITAVVGGAAVGYTIGHRDGTALADIAEEAAETAGDVVNDLPDMIKSVSDAIQGD